ncbi:MAG: phage head closure protein [Cetobacterium sp.]
MGGDLDRRITLERFSKIRDSLNTPVETWTVLATVWAKKADASDREMTASQQIGSALQSWFTIRSSILTRTVTPKDRIVFGGQVWNITGTKETTHGRFQYIELTAVKRSEN